MAKRVGLDLLESNEFRCRDLLDFAEIRFGADGEGQAVRKPTQQDIDAFLGR